MDKEKISERGNPAKKRVSIGEKMFRGAGIRGYEKYAMFVKRDLPVNVYDNFIVQKDLPTIIYNVLKITAKNSKDVSETLAQYNREEIDKIIKEEFEGVLKFKTKSSQLPYLPNPNINGSPIPGYEIPLELVTKIVGGVLISIALSKGKEGEMYVSDEEMKIYEKEVIQEVTEAVIKRIEADKRDE
jgi:hypothetical protein